MILSGIAIKKEAPTYKGLRRFNIVMGMLHFFQAALILVISSSFTLPITSSFLKYNSVTQHLDPTVQVVYNLPIAPMIALFLFISATDHLILSTPHAFKWYVANLENHINYARWIEYAISSSVMMIVISMLVGIYDIVSLIAIFSVNACMNLFGMLMEMYNQKRDKVNWTPYIFGTLAGLVPWIGITIYLAGSASMTSASIPTFVYFIFISLALFFFSFAFNMILQYKKVGRWKNYLYGEYIYIVLSLVAKTALAWQVFAGTLRPV